MPWLKPAKNSLFAQLLRSPWWVSMLIGATMAVLALALLPERFRVVGAISGLPFAVVGLLAARRQWHLPSAQQAAQIRQALGAMPWPTFEAWLQQAFERDGYRVQRGAGAAADFELERQGRRCLVAARRWKSARVGLEALRALQAAREAGDVSDALLISLGELSETAAAYAAQHGIEVWPVDRLLQALHGLPMPPAPRR